MHQRMSLRANSGHRQLLDHLVGAGEQRWWHSQADCLRRFEIDDHFVFRRYLHRHIARLLPFEDTIDVAGRVPLLVGIIGSIRLIAFQKRRYNNALDLDVPSSSPRSTAPHPALSVQSAGFTLSNGLRGCRR
jgi:hypothetical protein